MMREHRGQMAMIAVIFLIFIFFIIYFAFSIFNKPVTEVIDAVDKVDADNTIPGGILPGLDLAWAIWPIVMFIILFIVALAYVYKRDMEHSYGGYEGY